MAEHAVEARDLVRTFDDGTGVRGVDIWVDPGAIHALVGLNGAGKTTLMRLLLGMLEPATGTITIAGQDLDHADWTSVGHLVDYPLAYRELTCRQNLALGARLHGVAPANITGLIEAAIAELGLTQYADRRAVKLSLGNRQRLGLASALQHDPRFVVLDEPTNTLDPAGVILLREALLHRAGAGSRRTGQQPSPRRGRTHRRPHLGPERRTHHWHPRPARHRHRAILLRPRPHRRRGRMIIGLVTEFTKLAHATVVRATTVLMVFGISLICASMLLAVHTDDPQLAAKLGPLIDPGGWAGYLAVAVQVTGAAGFVGYGVVLSWLFSREFADGTIAGLFAIPVSRREIAAAKLIVYVAWGLVTATALLLALIVLGLASGLGTIPADAVPWIGRQFAISVFSIVIATPAAWAATLGRSVLAGIATTIAILVLSQVSVIAGAGGWFPFAAPALWAIHSDITVTPLQLTLVIPVVALGVALTLRSWRRLQLDR